MDYTTYYCLKQRKGFMDNACYMTFFRGTYRGRSSLLQKQQPSGAENALIKEISAGTEHFNGAIWDEVSKQYHHESIRNPLNLILNQPIFGAIKKMGV